MLTKLLRDREMCLRRSRTRALVLLSLAALGHAYPSQIARWTGIRSDRVLGALVGDVGEFRVELALVRLGYARMHQSALGPSFELTDAGLVEAQALARSFREEAKSTIDETDLARARWAPFPVSFATPEPAPVVADSGNGSAHGR